MMPRFSPLLISAPLVSAAVIAFGLFAQVAWDQRKPPERVAAKLQEALRDLGREHAGATELPENERSALHAALRAEMPHYRWEAARRLGASRDRRSINALLAAMRDESGTQRTCLMAQALGHIGDREAVKGARLCAVAGNKVGYLLYTSPEHPPVSVFIGRRGSYDFHGLPATASENNVAIRCGKCDGTTIAAWDVGEITYVAAGTAREAPLLAFARQRGSIQ